MNVRKYGMCVSTPSQFLPLISSLLLIFSPPLSSVPLPLAPIPSLTRILKVVPRLRLLRESKSDPINGQAVVTTGRQLGVREGEMRVG